MDMGIRVLCAGVLCLLLSACTSTEPVAEDTTTTAPTAPTTTMEPALTTTTTEGVTTTTIITTTTEAVATERRFGLVKPFTVVIPPDWTRDADSDQNQLAILAGSNSLFFGVEGPDTTVDSWVLRLTDHPNLVTTEPMPTEVGGASGQVLDISLGDGASSIDCPEPCVPVYAGTPGWAIFDGLPNRVWIVDVDGTAVMIAAEATEGDFESHVAEIEAALATLEWVEE